MIRHTETFRLLTPDELLAQPAMHWLVEGLVPASGLTVLYGASGAFKSFLSLDMACCVATGVSWLGRAVERRRVVYVAAEGQAGLAARYRAWSAARGNPDASWLHLLPESVDLLDDDQVGKVRRTLNSLSDPPGLLVVDTMARTMVSGDENSARDIGQYVASIDELRGPGVAWLNHHPGKDNGLERGSGALRAAADLMTKVTRDKKSRRLKLSCEKLKDAAEWASIPLEMKECQGSLVPSLGADQGASEDDLLERILGCVRDCAPLSGTSVAERVRRRKADVLRALSLLDNAGKVTETDLGWIPVPETGEPAGNRQIAASVGDGSRGEAPPVGGLSAERAPAGHSASVPGGLESGS